MLSYPTDSLLFTFLTAHLISSTAITELSNYFIYGDKLLTSIFISISYNVSTNIPHFSSLFISKK